MGKTIGFHYIIEASGCDKEILTNLEKLKEILINSAKISKMDIKSVYFFRFNPEGVSGFVVVAESHISIHTWPEEGYAAIDVYTCGTKAEPEKAVDFILKEIKAKEAHITELKRGIKDENEYTHSILTWEENLKGKKI
jgi:S-adenosylmethionine decarboxylase